MRVAAILDDFSLDCFKYECDLKLVTPENWMSEITEYKPAFLFVESAWHGNGEAWVKQLTNAQDSPSSELISLVLWCRNRGIKTVFWNKEDPPNYNHFTNCARLFEYVFTTDENCIPKYLHDVGHDKVMALPFAAQPKIHNPISDGAPRENNVAFAGSWYANKHPDRKTDMENLLQPAMDFDLHIFDRNHDRADSSFKYPDNYHDAIKGGLPYSEMVVAYRKYKTFLNVNSVQNSPTMFSRRVFELLACNTTVISGYSTGIENMLGDLVLMTRSQKETRKHLENILSNEYSRERLAHQGMRKVLTEHTYKNRLNSILEFIGIQSTEDPEEKVSVITYTNKPEMLDRILSNYERQLHPNKELVLILNNNFFNKDKVKKTIKKRNIVSATVIQLPENSSLGTCLNTAIEASTGEYLTKFDDKNHYADYFISDLLLPFEYTEAHIVGKCSYYTYLEGQRILALHSPKNEHKYVKFIHDSAMLVKREIFKKIRFAENSLDQNANFSNDCIEAGYKMYSADRFNYVCIQPDVEKKHMSKTEQDSYLQECEIVATVDNYEEITNVTDNVYYCN